MSETRLPKVVVLIPSSDMFKADMAMSLAGMTAYSMYGASIALINEKSSMITKARNSLVQKALDLGAEWLLFVDSDMAFPADALLRLLSHEKDIVGATYAKRVPPYETLGHFLGEARQLEGGLIEADFMPGGFMLINADVFRSMTDPTRKQQFWYREDYADEVMSEDYVFCRSARAAGYQIWCDLDLTAQITHIGEQHVTCNPTKMVSG